MPQKFPGYRLPQVSDNLEEDVQFDIDTGGDGCLGVASADFDGDGATDYAVGLTPISDREPLVVAALRRKDTFAVFALKSWVDRRTRLYVKALPAGTYKRSEALDEPLEQGEQKSIRCRHSVVVVGATESTAIVYCYDKNRWRYVWSSV